MFDLVRKVGTRGLLVAAIATGAALLSSPADARGWHGGGGWHGGVYVGIGGLYDPWWPGYYPGYWGPGYYPYYADPPVTVIQQAPVAQAPVAPAGPPTYYYCDNPAGYYPYVQQCGTPWRPVAATPAPASAPH
ncbi:MAG TPA: hypothetical protein VKP60_12435 [Magnetospirillaceae bacterium]|nr:hypothetical protein [Magnetospirillaceae bacterium]